MSESHKREVKLITELAQRVSASKNCAQIGNNTWEVKHDNAIEQLIEILPHGSGIDGTTELSFDESKEDKIVITSSFHHMNDVGMYDGWTDFKLVIRPSLIHGFTLKVIGSFPRKYSDTRDYLAEIFSHALDQKLIMEITGKGNDAESSFYEIN